MEREQRPIAHIVGAVCDLCPGVTSGSRWCPERRACCPSTAPTVDDMLAWSARRGWTLLNCISDRHGYRLCLEATGVVGPDVDGAGPTLTEAVENAVRGVAGSTNQEPDDD